MAAPSRESYATGIICALALEKAAVLATLDEKYCPPKDNTTTSDSNIYTFGRIGEHKVVIACLPAGVTGKVSAATVAMDMMHSFPIKIGLMVGIGGGVWSVKDDVRLGDVVVSQPDGMHGGVVQWDFGKMEAEGRFRRTGTLNKPPRPLLNAVQSLKTDHIIYGSKLQVHLTAMWQKYPRMAKIFQSPGQAHDDLFEASYTHPHGDNCALCDELRLVHRPNREETTPQVHYGSIASGDEVMKDGVTRDRIAREEGILCFEMEAAGLMDSFLCIVIRGICDYADSHKNKQWQPYAAATAASYCKELLGVIDPKAIDELKSPSQPAMRFDCIPLSPNKKFVGRAKELKMLETALFAERSTQHIAIVGLGGVGKTQVALAFAYSVMDNHPDVSVLWLPAMSVGAFEQGCREIARVLGIPMGGTTDAREPLRQRLSLRTSGPWLLIVDNADDSDILFGAKGETGLLSFLPKSSLGSIVYTTRSREIAQSLARNDVVKVSRMGLDEATEMLRLALDHDTLTNEQKITEALLEELECLPLAITQAASYMNCTNTSLSGYLDLLKGSEDDLAFVMGQEMRDSTRYEHSTSAIATTWLVSFKQMLRRDPDAADLLQFMSCIESKSIPRSILPEIKPAARATSAIGTLCSYSFISMKDGEHIYDLHRLVHLAAQIWVRQSKRTVQVRERAIRHLATVFPCGGWKNRKIWQSYNAHAFKVLGADEPKYCVERAMLCYRVGVCLFRDQKYKDAVRCLEEAYYCYCYGQEYSMGRLQTLLQLAISYGAMGQAKRATEVLKPVGYDVSCVLGKDHPYTQDVLSAAYLMKGPLPERLLEHVVAIQRELPEPAARKAAEQREPLLEVKLRLCSEHDPTTMSVQHALATGYQADGEMGPAVILRELLFATQRRAFPHNEVVEESGRNALISAYVANQQTSKAVGLMERAVANQVQVLEEGDSRRLRSIHNLASVYLAHGRPEKAAALLAHVVSVEAGILPEDHPNLIASQRDLANVQQTCEHAVEMSAQQILDKVVIEFPGLAVTADKDSLAIKRNYTTAFGGQWYLSRPCFSRSVQWRRPKLARISHRPCNLRTLVVLRDLGFPRY
ncbi:hypothetical protein LTR97_011999 [Elasticomyces elasticus]|uniref:Nucleoside phosphorylase domain-containing protein n=1 Tax=Elasticomyces elasticus TaxID=574655 RepID=A0AAN7ZZH4_9PEZI|nr:hypothetical protein LTR97_011999 [Elasticomyces elasticus]